MSTPPALHQKTLPVFFMEGYLDSLWSAVGMGQLTTTYQLAAQQLIPDKSMRDLWLNPLLVYFRHGTNTPEPLDYRFVALFQYGFHLYGPQYIKAAQIFTRCAGKDWWFGKPPISAYQDKTGLQKHFAPHIWAALNPRKFGAPGITSHTVTGPCDLGIIGLTTFLDHFQQESRIAFQVNIDSTSIDIEVIECPFCLHEHDLCYVFPGMFSGLLDWLHSHWRDERRARQYLTLNEHITTNHRMVIDIHHAGLDIKLPPATS